MKRTLRMSPRPKSATERANKKFFGDLKNSREYRELRSYLMRRFLTSEAMTDLFRLTEADAILGEFETWRSDPSRIAPYALEPNQKILSLLRDEIPPVSRLLQAKETVPGLGEVLIFPPTLLKRNDGKTQNAEKNVEMHWIARPVPRRFHAILFPCINGECVRDTPDRWLTPALQNTRFWSQKETAGSLATHNSFPCKLATRPMQA